MVHTSQNLFNDTKMAVTRGIVHDVHQCVFFHIRDISGNCFCFGPETIESSAMKMKKKNNVKMAMSSWDDYSPGYVKRKVKLNLG